MGEVSCRRPFLRICYFQFEICSEKSSKSPKMVEAFDMGPAGRVSPFIKASRWTLLIVGIWWGNKRWNQHRAVAVERQAYEARMKPIWDAEAKAKREKENREGMIKLAKEVGVKVPANF